MVDAAECARLKGSSEGRGLEGQGGLGGLAGWCGALEWAAGPAIGGLEGWRVRVLGVRWNLETTAHGPASEMEWAGVLAWPRPNVRVQFPGLSAGLGVARLEVGACAKRLLAKKNNSRPSSFSALPPPS